MSGTLASTARATRSSASSRRTAPRATTPAAGELLFDLTTNVRRRSRPTAGRRDGSARSRRWHARSSSPIRAPGGLDPPAGWPEPETAELLDPAPAELDAVARDDLVGSRFGPGATVPGHSELAARLLVRMLGAPLGFVPVDVGGDLPGARREAPDVGSQLHDLTGLSGPACTRGRQGSALNSGSHMTAACPMPLIAPRLSRTPTVCRPRHRSPTRTRALICRWRWRCGSPAREV